MKIVGTRPEHFFLGIVAWLALLPVAIAANNFVPIRLPHGIHIQLPRNWSVMSSNKRITLDTWKDSLLEEHNLHDVESDLPFAANYFDDRGNTAGTFAIRYYPTITITQTEALQQGGTFIKELDAGLRQAVGQGIELSGGKLVAWMGTTKRAINGSIFFISENRQLSPRGDGFHGTLVRYLNAGKSFTIIISYREDQEFYLRPICERIISSIRL